MNAGEVEVEVEVVLVVTSTAAEGAAEDEEGGQVWESAHGGPPRYHCFFHLFGGVISRGGPSRLSWRRSDEARLKPE